MILFPCKGECLFSLYRRVPITFCNKGEYPVSSTSQYDCFVPAFTAKTNSTTDNMHWGDFRGFRGRRYRGAECEGAAVKPRAHLLQCGRDKRALGLSRAHGLLCLHDLLGTHATPGAEGILRVGEWAMEQ